MVGNSNSESVDKKFNNNLIELIKITCYSNNTVQNLVTYGLVTFLVTFTVNL